MTINTTRTPQQASVHARSAREAWEAGKRIQWASHAEPVWRDWVSPGTPDFANPKMIWQTPPEPPKPKYRCFYTTEIPVGAEARYKDNKSSVRHLLLCNSENGLWGQGTFVSFEDLLNEFEYKWPHEPETAWRPCGVEVAP